MLALRGKPAGLALLLAALGSHVRAEAPANGLYATIGSGGVIVKALDGNEIHLGERLTDTIEKATLNSTSNDNKQFSVLLRKTSAFSRDYGSIALYVDDFCVRFYGGGSNAVYAIVSPEAARAFARFFGVSLHLRAHPGYALATRFVPAKDVFSSDEALPVTLAIENVGRIPVSFRVGGANRGARDNQFGFTAYGPTGAVADTGDPVNFGGLSGNRVLKPGEIFRKEVDLRKWFTFKQPGRYTITGTYDLAFSDPATGDYFSIWEDKAAANFYVTIK